MITNQCGIYKITNVVTGDYYIGSSDNIRRRIDKHRYGLVHNKHCNIHLQRAWNKYGEQAFEFAAILLCDVDRKLPLEQAFLDLLHPAYNISICAAATWQGLHHTKEACAKMSETRVGVHHTEASKRKMSEILIGNKRNLGCHQTEATLLKRSETMKAKYSGQGQHPSEETRAKMSEARKLFWKNRRTL